jgi:Uma2 family endonuclease
MPFTVADQQVRPLTAAEVLRMVELGILDGDERVELLHGALVKVSPQGDAHALVLRRLLRWAFESVAPGRYDFSPGAPLRIPDGISLPEPDIAIIERSDVVAYPTTALLAIEVSVSSLRLDTTIKPALYASAAIVEYWVVDVEHRRLEVFTDPGPTGYATRTTHEPPEHVTPFAIEAEPLDLEALLTGV